MSVTTRARLGSELDQCGPRHHGGPHSPADTEWVRDLMEMGGVSEELSMMSPASGTRGSGTRPWG